MKKMIVVKIAVILSAVLLFVACGAQTDDVIRLEEEISRLETEQYRLIHEINEQAQIIIDLEGLRAPRKTRLHVI